MKGLVTGHEDSQRPDKKSTVLWGKAPINSTTAGTYAKHGYLSQCFLLILPVVTVLIMARNGFLKTSTCPRKAAPQTPIYKVLNMRKPGKATS